MLVSAVIPTRGTRPEWLKQAIESVKNQTVPVLEIIIGKPDWGDEKFNKAMSKVKGDAYFILADDDLIDPTFVEKTTKEMEKSQCDIVATLLETFGTEVEWDEIHAPSRHPFFTSLCKTKYWDIAGGMNMDVGAMSDIDYWYRCFKAGATWSILPEPLFKYRKHPEQDSNSTDWEDSRKKMLAKHPEYEF